MENIMHLHGPNGFNKMKTDWRKNKDKLTEIIGRSLEKAGESGTDEFFYEFCEKWGVGYWSRFGNPDISDIWYEYRDMVCINCPYLEMDERPDCLFLTQEFAEKVLVLGGIP